MSLCEGEGRRRKRMIAQGRVSENLAPLSWHTYHRVTVYTAQKLLFEVHAANWLRNVIPSQIARERSRIAD